MLQLATAFHDENPFRTAQTGLFLKREKALQLGILGRCDYFRIHSYSITALTSL